MEANTINKNRRQFIKVTTLGTGGLVLGFNMWSCKPEAVVRMPKAMPSEWTDINAYLKIGDTGLVTIFSPNPEIGQNIKTSMPMIVAEELDVDWIDVVVEQTGLNTDWFKRQVAGGSQSIRQEWGTLRKAGATAKQMLMQAAANTWGLDVSECSAADGIVSNAAGEQLSYGELASKAAELEVPEDVELKSFDQFKIIGQSKVNVDMENILTGQPVFGIDFKREGMSYASVLRPPAFGKKLVSYDDTEAKTVTGVSEIIQFGDKVAVLADNHWSAMKAKNLIKAEWTDDGRIEDTAFHDEQLNQLLDTRAEEPRRKDGDAIAALQEADEAFERSYSAPFLPHSCLEPMNFFAHVTDEKVELIGPIQTPAWTERRVADLLGRDAEEITIDMTRMGGGFGRRLYGDFTLEAAEISSKTGKPIQVLFTREDDMLAGTYRPASKYKFRVGIKDGKISAYHLTEACVNGQMFGSMPSNFPAGAIENYLCESHTFESNITTGAWRAPYANFLAYAEQAFFDELAMHLKKDPIAFRLELFEQAKANPVGEEHNYNIDQFVAVIKEARDKSSWGNAGDGVYLGFSAYYSHNTYVAEVAEAVIEDDVPVIKKIHCAVDCGIVINPKAAINQIEGGIVDGIGHAMYGDFQFVEGRTQQTNFHNYRMIRIDETPEIEVYFVNTDHDPTGLGEPTLPPAGGAIANAFAAATGKRFYSQPFIKYEELLG